MIEDNKRPDETNKNDRENNQLTFDDSMTVLKILEVELTIIEEDIKKCVLIIDNAK